MTVSKATTSRALKQRVSGRAGAYLTNAARGASNNCIVVVSGAATRGEGTEARRGGCLPALTMIAVFGIWWGRREGRMAGGVEGWEEV